MIDRRIHVDFSQSVTKLGGTSIAGTTYIIFR